MIDSASPRPDLCVFIGRFQPEHVGHDAVIREGLARANHVLVLVGSAHEARSYYNPFTAEERIQMIRATFDHDPRLLVAPLEDAHDSTRWVTWTRAAVQAQWTALRQDHPELPVEPRVALIGHTKDATSYYLELFPDWMSIEMAPAHVLSATALRAALFGQPGLSAEEIDAFPATSAGRAAYRQVYANRARAQAQAFLATMRGAAEHGQAQVSKAVLAFLDDFLITPAYLEMCFEHAMVRLTKHAWRHAPYPPASLTADAAVIQAGKVLMVRRKGYPGRGLWALPGGFVEEDERIEAAAWRELHEETGLDVPDAMLRQHRVGWGVFDDPRRSSRGRTVTQAFLVVLPDNLPVNLCGQKEEVLDVQWRPLTDVRRDQCFEDHYGILLTLLRQQDDPTLHGLAGL